jgi:predicted nucleic acid-binding protein
MAFVEGSFIVSLFHKKSKKHEKSKKIFYQLGSEYFIISYMVIAEVLTILRKLNVDNSIVEDAYETMIKMIVIDDTVYFEKAFKYSLKNEIGFYNNLYYIIMKELKISDIISFDKDFDTLQDINRIH